MKLDAVMKHQAAIRSVRYLTSLQNVIKLHAVFMLTDLHVVVLQDSQDFLRSSSEDICRLVPKLAAHQIQQGLVGGTSLLCGWPI